MLEKYFNGVIEQTYHRIGTLEKSIVVAKYSNDFSLNELEIVKRYSENEDNVFFACYEWNNNQTLEAFEPFLQIIKIFLMAQPQVDLDKFMDECGVYSLHREIFRSYFEEGICRRAEKLILGEVDFERKQMVLAVVEMLRKMASIQPVLILINRFQYANRSTMEVIRRLLEKPTEQIGIIMAVNGEPSVQSTTHGVWLEILEKLEAENKVYHMGDSGRSRVERAGENQYLRTVAQELTIINNTIYFLDFEYACHVMEYMKKQDLLEHRNATWMELMNIYLLYIYASIFNKDLSVAFELLASMEREELDTKMLFHVEFLRAIAYMYKGMLPKSIAIAKKCQELAEENRDEYELFLAQLVEVEAKMSGWYNIFYCIRDYDIPEEFLTKLRKFDYKNHLAHIYIYAYDNDPTKLAKSYNVEQELSFFNKGIEMAKELQNVELICSAYQKNLMIAAANGMFEIAVLYSIRTYQAIDKEEVQEIGRIYSGLGYNLSAMGDSRRADLFYRHAISLLYKARLPEDIAEVHYNMALNCIQQEQYQEAEHYLMLSMKAIERLHLNSLRVANLSKLYALLALVNIMQGDRFNCERNLMSCRQFLNYSLERGNQNIDMRHDYANCDDDMFLYTFGRGLFNRLGGEKEAAMECFLQAERYLINSEGNQFYVHKLFSKERMELFREMGREMLYEIEKERYEKHMSWASLSFNESFLQLLEEVDLEEEQVRLEEISEAGIENLMKQEGLFMDLQNNRRQMEFISEWQKLIDDTHVKPETLVERAMRTFLTHFNNDCAVYIRYREQRPEVLYNNTEKEIHEDLLLVIGKSMQEYPQGFAASKIRSNYFEFSNLISFFGEDEVCSFVAVPFYKDNCLESVLLTYVMMRDNWHSSIERYMLTEDDLHIYRLLFQEMSYSLKRLEDYEKMFEMNRQLSQVAVTDLLTGIYNRSGLYQQIAKSMNSMRPGCTSKKMSLMFIDLDNFKTYNDTFGHAVGDEVLVAMSEIFTKAVDEKGFVCRYGGDEFIAILDTTDRMELEEIAKEIYAEIACRDGFMEEIRRHHGEDVELEGRHKLSCSIGITSKEHVSTEEDVFDMIKKADNVLYQVKEGTKGTYEFT